MSQINFRKDFKRFFV